MSNPAVIKLQKGKIKQSNVWLDDNFGEAIHIHIDDHRVDLTVKEFKQLYNDLCVTLNEIFPIEGFDFSDIDPVFLSEWLVPILPTITHAKYDKVFLEDLYGPHPSTGCVKLDESVGVKALKGLSMENEGYRKSHHIGQTDNQRLHESLESIKENGYPYNNKYIVVRGDNNIIFDGQHRASCLYYLYGNIEVPVLRIYSPSFANDKIPVKRIYHSWSIYLWCKNLWKKMKHGIKKIENSINMISSVSHKKIANMIKKIRNKYKLHSQKVNHPIDKRLSTLFGAK